jgi:mono/diheme cytochrome c family protein
MFTQTEERPPAPPEGQDFTYPEFYKTSMRFPEGASYERGQQVYLAQCAHCHGLAGDGQGWDGEYLVPQPADFREMKDEQMTPEAQGEHFAIVTFGIQDTAMPSWGEFLPVEKRWDAIKYLMGTFMGDGMPATISVYQEGRLPANFVTLSSDLYLEEGHTISPTHGAALYATYCATCHGDGGQGNGPGTADSASGGPSVFPSDMGEAYIYWRTWEGVPDSTMYSFKRSLSDSDVWDITTYVDSLTSTGKGGGQ